MKWSYLFVIVILFSCSKKIVSSASIELLEELQMGVLIDQGSNLQIIFKNNSKDDLKVSDPKCIVNCSVEITSAVGRNRAEQQVMIKPNLDCIRRMVDIGKGAEKSFMFHHKLAELFLLNQGIEYNVKVVYERWIVNAEGLR